MQKGNEGDSYQVREKKKEMTRVCVLEAAGKVDDRVGLLGNGFCEGQERP